MLFEAGRAIPRDVLDALEDLVSAQNAVTQALVDHYISRMNFLRDTGTLLVDIPRFWEILNVEKPQAEEPEEVLTNKTPETTN